MSALLAAQGQSIGNGRLRRRPAGPDALQDLFSQIDANGDGQITKSEFENALGAGGTNIAQADDVFNKLDKDGGGSVSLDEMSSALKGAAQQGPPSSCAWRQVGRIIRRQRRLQRIEHRSAVAGDAGYIQLVGDQQRRLDHDLADLCRWLEGDDDLAGGNGSGSGGIQCRDVVLQSHRTDDSARGQGDFILRRLALGQRLKQV